MSSETFSRSYLQGLPEQQKRQHIETFVQEVIGAVQSEATLGKTSYMYDPAPQRGFSNHIHLPITNDDLVVAIQRKFPDCSVSYQEIWVDAKANTKVLKKGIVIDWS